MSYSLQKSETENKIQTKAEQYLAKVKEINIETEDHLASAADFLKIIKKNYNDAESERKTLIKPFRDGVDQINGRFKSITEPLKDAEKILKDKVLKCQRVIEEEKRKKIKEEQDRIAEEARKQAEKERIEAEEEAKKLAESGAEEEAKKLAEEAKKKEENFNQQLNNALAKPVEIEKTRGSSGAVTSIRKKTVFRVTDIEALVKSKPHLVDVNQTKVMACFRSGEKEIPGIEFYEEETVSVR